MATKSDSGRDVEARDDVEETPLGEAPATARQLEQLAALPSDLRCGNCGYGVASYVSAPECPMCRQRCWQPAGGGSGRVRKPA